MTVVLQVDGLATHFTTKAGLVKAVDGVDLTVARGEVLGLVGESGSGKSITGLSIMRLVDPPGRIVAGRVVFDGIDLSTLDAEAMRRIRGNRIAMIFQDPMTTLNPVLSIGTQMIEAMDAHPDVRAGTDPRRRAIDALDRVGIASAAERLAAYPHQLSGGMRQRVAIAIALLNDPDLVLCDEPTTALDVTIQAQILALMQTLIRASQLALIWITHDLTVVAGLADRIAVMYAGRIVESGTAAEIIGTPRHPYTRGLIESTPAAAALRGDANRTDRRLKQIPGSPPSMTRLPQGCAFRPRCPNAQPDCFVEPPAVVDATGRSLRCFHPLTHDSHEPGSERVTKPLIELRGIGKRFVAKTDLSTRIGERLRGRHEPRVVHAVDDVDLAIDRGEVVGLVGESGCGKSTLGRIVAGLQPPTTGTIEWDRDPVGGQRSRLRAQMIFQDPYASLNPRMRVADLVGEAPVVHGTWRRDERDSRAIDLLERVGLDATAMTRYPHQFSGGQRARIGIARALAVEPELLVCDEAVAALDVSTQAQVLNLFMDLQQDTKATLGLTYLFISHDLAVVRHLSDRVLIMYLGRIVESAPTPRLFAHPNHPYTQALLAETPTLAVGKRAFTAIRGEIPSPLSPPSGCHFHPRCPRASEVPDQRCARERPLLASVGPGHASACHLNDLQVGPFGRPAAMPAA